TYECSIEVRTLNQGATSVLVTDTIPKGATLVTTEPKAMVKDMQLNWQLNNIKPEEVRIIKVQLKAGETGKLASCSTVTAVPQGCLETVVANAKLNVKSTGPQTARINTDFEYNIEISNTGDIAARNVVLTNALPEGLRHASESQVLELLDQNISLEPGETISLKVPVKATKIGKVCNPIVAKATNAKEVTAEICTMIIDPKLAITKTGTKEQFIGKNANYEIIVSNPGTVDLTDVSITDQAPKDARVIKAPDAVISADNSTATWRLPKFAAGAKKTLSATLTTPNAGNSCNLAMANQKELGLSEQDKACTKWKGQAALLIELVDSPDPILVGESSTYTIRVTNQGTAPDSNIKIVANFAKEIDPISVAKQSFTTGTVNGKQVSFTPVAILKPKESVAWMINAKGATTGDHRLRILVSSDLLSIPVTEEESTHVY
ncbi:hypothetical protein TI05_07605, partial [Achromatium sp. WMS3]